MARCEICGKSTTMAWKRFCVPDRNGRKHEVCKECTEKATASGKSMKYDEETRTIVLVDPKDLDICKKCNVCGFVFCYSNMDVMRNRQEANQAKWAAIGALGGAMSGHYAASAVNVANANNAANQIRDYNKCPNCGSVDLRTIDKETYLQEKKSESGSAPALSSADELKKFKELLDTGVISQEEFDAKKKQLLGL